MPRPADVIKPLPANLDMAALAAHIETVALEKMRARLSLGKDKDIPPEVAQIVKSQAAAIAKNAITLGASRDAETAARQLGQAVITEEFLDKMTAARDGIARITNAEAVDDILRERANLLAKKHDALKTAGFSPEDAMAIILADIAAAAH